ncbi:MAG: insulinase family protein [Epsilonproteobacteria bacterium]|nr:insulinase family protein [Campylobacterota bacterium]
MAAKLLYVKIDGINVPIVFEEYKKLPLKHLELVFRDSGFLASKKGGLVSMSSKLLNEGSLKSGSEKFARELEDRAITLSAGEGRETFVINLEALKEEFDFGFNKLLELLEGPNYKEEVLSKIKRERIGEIERKKGDFDYIAAINLRKILFKNTPLANPQIGTIEDIKSITLDEIKNYLDSHLHLDNLIVVAGGDFSEDELKELTKKIAKVLKRGEVPKIKHFDASDSMQEVKKFEDTKQAYIYFGAPYYMKVDSKDRVIGKVASFILGSSGFGSRLMEEIRVKRGLAYSAYSRFVVNKTHSYFSGYLQTKLKSQKEAIDVVKKVIADFVKNGVKEEELKDAKKFFLGSEPLRNETLAQRMMRAFHEYYEGLGIGYSKKELERIKNITLKEINEFIKQHPEILKLSFSIVTSKDGK